MFLRTQAPAHPGPRGVSSPARLLLAGGIAVALATACSSSDDDDDGGGDALADDVIVQDGDVNVATDTDGDMDTGNGPGSNEEVDADTDGVMDTDTDTTAGVDGSGGNIAQIGFVTIGVDDGGFGAETAVVAFFVAPGTFFPAAELDQAIGVFSGGNDACFVSDESDDPDDDFGPFDIDFDIGVTLSAGEALTITSAAGTYATLLREEVPNFLGGGTLVTYLPEGGSLAGEPPTGLVLDIPGDVFPAFSGARLPDVPPALNDLNPAEDSSIASDATFTWTPSGSARAVVQLALEGSPRSVDCILVDDGSFSLPTSIARQVDNALVVDDAQRNGIETLRSGDAALIMISSDGR